MSWLEFIRQILDVLIWPSVVVVLAIIFRKRADLLLASGRLRKFRAGLNGLEVEWDEAARETGRKITEEVSTSDEAENQTMPIRLLEIAEKSPLGAIAEASAEIETTLRTIIDDSGYEHIGRRRKSMKQLSETALSRELISPSLNSAIIGLTTLRNLALHGEEKISREKALEFIAIADAVMFSLTAPNGS